MICKAVATGLISVDIDLPKFYFCKEHKDPVQTSILFAILGNMEMSDKIILEAQKKHDKETKHTDKNTKPVKRVGNPGRTN